MNTVELLQHLNFQPSDLMGMGFDPQNPTEFTVNILKDGGAEDTTYMVTKTISLSL